MPKPHPKEKLKDLQLKRLTKPGTYADGRGLYFNVDPGGSRSWVFRYMLDGRRRKMGLGSYPEVSLAEAREHLAYWRKILKGNSTTPPRDPLDLKREKEAEARKNKRQLVTFDQVAEKFINANRSAWSNPKHAQQWERTLAQYASPIIGNRHIADIDTDDILQVLEPIWTTKTETATRVRGRIEKVIDYARARKLRTEENPARWRGHLDALLAKPSKVARAENFPSLPYQRIGAFISALRESNSISALTLEFLILTNTRTGDVLEADWSEIDLNTELWTIPEYRLKTRKEHIVPLSDRAIEILTSLENKNDKGLIFQSPRGGQLSNMAMLKLIKSMDNEKTPWRAPDGRVVTPHGFRTTFRTWAGECTAYPRDLIEFAMAHQLKDKAEAAYHRSTLPEKRRKLMQDWANRIGQPEAQQGEVIPIRDVLA